MEVGKNGVPAAPTAANGISTKKPHKKKANKHKSRNDFSDVQRIELNPTTAPVTTMDLLKNATDLDDLSQKLGERLALSKATTNGTHDGDQTTTTAGQQQQPNVDLEQPMDSTSPISNNITCSDPAQGGQVVPGAESGIESSNSTPSSSVGLNEASPKSLSSSDSSEVKIEYREYESELQMPDIIRLIQRDLSEPYSIYTYRYFIHNWPELCFLAMHGDLCVGAIVCKLGMHRQIMKRGYIAMLAVDKEYRKLKIGTNLVQKAIEVGVWGMRRRQVPAF